MSYRIDNFNHLPHVIPRASAAADGVMGAGTAAALAAPIKRVVSQAAAATITLSPPALMVQSVRVTAGLSAGVRSVGDSGATPSVTVCALSDDGATLTFDGATLTGAVIVYVPRS